jgi:hypothetical protein
MAELLIGGARVCVVSDGSVMPGNEVNNTGAEQQPQAGERIPPPAPVLPPPPEQVTPHKMAVVQLILHYCEYRKVPALEIVNQGALI